MWFFSSLYKSLYDREWLKAQRHFVGRAWAYFFLLIFFVTGLTVMPIILDMPNQAEKLRNKITNHIPDFKAEIANGELSVTGLPQPYIVKEDNLTFVVDTVSTGTVSAASYVTSDNESALVITKNSIIAQSGNNTEMTETWKDTPNYSFDRVQLLAIMEKYLTPVTVYVVSGLIFLGFFFGLSVTTLLLVLGSSAICYLFAKKRRLGWNFRQIFTVGLFASTLSVVIGLIGGWLHIGLGVIQLAAMVAYLVTIVRVPDVEKNKEAE